MKILIINKKNGFLINTFQSGNPFAFVAYTQLDFDKVRCEDEEGVEYKPYKCRNCGTYYGGRLSTPCPNCQYNG